MRREVLGNQGSSPTIPKHKLRRQERAKYPGSIIFSVIASAQAASVSGPRRVLPAELFQEIQVNSGQWRRRFWIGSSRCEFHELLPGSLPYQRGFAAPFHLNQARPLPIRGCLGRGGPEDVIGGEQSLGMFVRGIFQPLVEGLAGIPRREFQ
jgi:hypothetical protein